MNGLTHSRAGRAAGSIGALAVGIVVVANLWLPVADAQQLGRLFTTPEERAELDEIRNDPDFGKEEAPEVVVVPEQGPGGPLVEHVTINGIVLRSSGNNYSWINGDNIRSGDATREGIRVETRQLSGGGTIRLVLPSGQDTVQLKPGQKIDVLTGSILEPYEQDAGEQAATIFEDVEEPETFLNGPSSGGDVLREDEIVEYGVYGTY